MRVERKIARLTYHTQHVVISLNIPKAFCTLTTFKHELFMDIHTEKRGDNFFHVLQKAVEMLSESELRGCDLSYHCSCFSMSSLGMYTICKNVSQT